MPNSASSSQDEPPRRERRKEARPGELLAAALDVFVEKGYAATRVDEVAARAGVSKGTLFLYFPSKEELFKAVVRENITGMYAGWSAEIDEFTADSAEMLVYAMNAWWQQVGRSKASGICKLMMAEACNFPELADFYEQEVEAPGTALLARIVQRGVDRGEFRPVDVAYAAYALKAPMMFLMLHPEGDSEGFDPERFLRIQIDLLLNGLAVLPGVASGAAAS
ncbi:TetR/AcrR family transcriptional regulator [Xylophilus sp. Leaf220]|uniref:TetR/AcrR family transcriptional regulator n=1 Tax=Xylophilus sp. Leaf220 TaxID=1735686 RepID=UPI0006F3B057|nr:TetR/AcrR family transcriptional regulator [Xylophilus sp. Leaf220]KQM75673.1 TetR family transcriptional regulator [Xylophilus sp. Leaf220]